MNKIEETKWKKTDKVGFEALSNIILPLFENTEKKDWFEVESGKRIPCCALYTFFGNKEILHEITEIVELLELDDNCHFKNYSLLTDGATYLHTIVGTDWVELYTLLRMNNNKLKSIIKLTSILSIAGQINRKNRKEYFEQKQNEKKFHYYL